MDKIDGCEVKSCLQVTTCASSITKPDYTILFYIQLPVETLDFTLKDYLYKALKYGYFSNISNKLPIFSFF